MTKLQLIPKEKGKIDVSLLLRRLNLALFPLVVFFSATQLAKHFWPPFAFVHGVRVDYLAPTLGLFDLLTLIFILTTPISLIDQFFRQFSFLLLFLSLNLLTSHFPLITLNYLLHLSLFSLSAYLLLRQYRNWLTFPLIASLFFQFCLALSQVLTAHAGLFYWLGERSLTLSSLGVAKAYFFHTLTLRAYGTFSHPNILAGWALLVLILVYRLTPKLILRLLALALTPGLLFLTQSRLALMGFLLFLIFEILVNFSFWFRFLLTTLIASLFFLTKPVLRSLALAKRFSLFKTSIQILSHFPWFGVGAGASLAFYTHLQPPQLYLQPDHNSFTLFLSWFGLFGLLPLLALFFSLGRRFQLYTSILILLLTFDHYFLTSFQGLFIINLFLYELNSH